MSYLSNWCSKLKAKLMTEIKPEDNLVRPPHSIISQMIDNKEVEWAAHNPASISTCMTCTYCLIKEVKDIELKDEEGQPLYTKPPEMIGNCMYMAPKYIIENIKPNWSCARYANIEEQFEDDVIPTSKRLDNAPD